MGTAMTNTNRSIKNTGALDLFLPHINEWTRSSKKLLIVSTAHTIFLIKLTFFFLTNGYTHIS